MSAYDQMNAEAAYDSWKLDHPALFDDREPAALIDNQFMVGDRVRVMSGPAWIVGLIGTVTEVRFSGDDRVSYVVDDADSFNESELEAV